MATKTKKASTTRRGFGSIKTMRSGRYQASYVGPDTARHAAPSTFLARMDAEGWLAAERRLIELDCWTSPASREAAKNVEDALTFRAYTNTWLPERAATKSLAPRTVAEYRRYLDKYILPAIGDIKLADVTTATVRAFVVSLGSDSPGSNFNVCALLKSIMATATEDDLVPRNPCAKLNLKKQERSIAEPATLAELKIIKAALPERLRLMVDLAAWCALRFGEVAELRRGDIDLAAGAIKVRRAVQWVDGQKIIKAPKADSSGVVHFPPHLKDAIKAHLKDHAQWGKDGLLFPTQNGVQYRPETFHHAHWRKARAAAERPDLRFHDLRHTGSMLAAEAGATLPEQMNRLRHKTAKAALVYQHAAQGSDKRIAAQLSAIAEAASKAN